MTELEDRLRSMLQERAGDIHAVPDRLLTIGVEEIAPPTPLRAGPRHRSPRSDRFRGPRAWLLSAAVVALVAAIALGLTALPAGRGDRSPEPAGTDIPTSAPTTVPSTPSVGPPRSAVSLDRFGTDPVTDYSVAQRSSDP